MADETLWQTISNAGIRIRPDFTDPSRWVSATRWQQYGPFATREEALSAAIRSLIANWRLVFILPPWKAIYTNDAERDQSFVDAVGVHARIEQWYGSCGYILHEVPRLAVPQRADHILRVLAESAA
jgi:hypothetical protein